MQGRAGAMLAVSHCTFCLNPKIPRNHSPTGAININSDLNLTCLHSQCLKNPMAALEGRKTL